MLLLRIIDKSETPMKLATHIYRNKRIQYKQKRKLIIWEQNLMPFLTWQNVQSKAVPECSMRRKHVSTDINYSPKQILSAWEAHEK